MRRPASTPPRFSNCPASTVTQSGSRLQCAAGGNLAQDRQADLIPHGSRHDVNTPEDSKAFIFNEHMRDKIAPAQLPPEPADTVAYHYEIRTKSPLDRDEKPGRAGE